MTRDEYVKSAVKSAERYIARGTDAQGNIIGSDSAYMRGTIFNAKRRFDRGFR